MSKYPRVCIDRVLPRDLRRAQMTRQLGGRVRAIAPVGRQWVNGSTIKIRLLGATPAVRKEVEDTAVRWLDYANLRFQFTDDPRAEIRVTFDASDGAWSYIGLDNLDIPQSAATLNLGWVDEGVILHEFGHMVGLAHEHQNPAGGIVWNEANVIRDLSGPPNNWDEATIRHNVLDKYKVDQIIGTTFDPDSIMLYEFPDDWTQNMGATHANSKISSLDAQFVRSERMYPRLGATPEEHATDLEIQAPTEGAIDAPGGESLFRFQVTRPGVFVIETSGSSDVVLTLLGPDSVVKKIAEDDDGGVSFNARIRAQLGTGSYYARVRHYSEKGTGGFGISVTAQP
jgi:hypothetical protein